MVDFGLEFTIPFWAIPSEKFTISSPFDKTFCVFQATFSTFPAMRANFPHLEASLPVSLAPPRANPAPPANNPKIEDIVITNHSAVQLFGDQILEKSSFATSIPCVLESI